MIGNTDTQHGGRAGRGRASPADGSGQQAAGNEPATGSSGDFAGDEPPADYPPPAAPGQTAAIIGLILGGVLILALGFWLGTRPQRPQVPQLTLVSPAAGTTVERPVELVFDVERARIRIGPGGWGYGTLHLHVFVDDREIMPGPDDIEYIGAPSRYRWTLPPVEPGERVLRLIWSDLRHRPLEDGAATAVRVHVN